MLLRLRDVLKKYPVSRSVWYAGVKDGRFPKPVHLSERTVAWLNSDIDKLVASIATAANDGEA